MGDREGLLVGDGAERELGSQRLLEAEFEVAQLDRRLQADGEV